MLSPIRHRGAARPAGIHAGSAPTGPIDAQPARNHGHPGPARRARALHRGSAHPYRDCPCNRRRFWRCGRPCHCVCDRSRRCAVAGSAGRQSPDHRRAQGPLRASAPRCAPAVHQSARLQFVSRTPPIRTRPACRPAVARHSDPISPRDNTATIPHLDRAAPDRTHARCRNYRERLPFFISLRRLPTSLVPRSPGRTPQPYNFPIYGVPGVPCTGRCAPSPYISTLYGIKKGSCRCVVPACGLRPRRAAALRKRRGTAVERQHHNPPRPPGPHDSPAHRADLGPHRHRQRRIPIPGRRRSAASKRRDRPPMLPAQQWRRPARAHKAAQVDGHSATPKHLPHADRRRKTSPGRTQRSTSALSDPRTQEGPQTAGRRVQPPKQASQPASAYQLLARKRRRHPQRRAQGRGAFDSVPIRPSCGRRPTPKALRGPPSELALGFTLAGQGPGHGSGEGRGRGDSPGNGIEPDRVLLWTPALAPLPSVRLHAVAAMCHGPRTAAQSAARRGPDGPEARSSRTATGQSGGGSRRVAHIAVTPAINSLKAKRLAGGCAHERTGPHRLTSTAPIPPSTIPTPVTGAKRRQNVLRGPYQPFQTPRTHQQAENVQHAMHSRRNRSCSRRPYQLQPRGRRRQKRTQGRGARDSAPIRPACGRRPPLRPSEAR